MTLIVIPFEPDHLQSFVPGKREERAMAKADIAKVQELWSGRAMAAIMDGQCVGVFGTIDTGRDVFLSVIMADKLRAHPVVLHRRIKRGLAAILSEGYETITTTARSEDSQGREWLKRLGFKFVDEQDGEVKYRLWKQPS